MEIYRILRAVNIRIKFFLKNVSMECFIKKFTLLKNLRRKHMSTIPLNIL